MAVNDVARSGGFFGSSPVWQMCCWVTRVLQNLQLGSWESQFFVVESIHFCYAIGIHRRSPSSPTAIVLDARLRKIPPVWIWQGKNVNYIKCPVYWWSWDSSWDDWWIWYPWTPWTINMCGNLDASNVEKYCTTFPGMLACLTNSPGKGAQVVETETQTSNLETSSCKLLNMTAECSPFMRFTEPSLMVRWAGEASNFPNWNDLCPGFSPESCLC